MRDNQRPLRLSETALALLTSVAVGVFCAQVQANDATEEFEGFASQKTYLEASPYASRRVVKDLPDTRRRAPMRFSSDTDASSLPSFGSYDGEKVKNPSPVPMVLRGGEADDVGSIDKVMVPLLGELVDTPVEMKTTPVPVKEPVRMEASVKDSKLRSGPQSILDALFFDSEKEEYRGQKESVSKIVRPAELLKVKTLPQKNKEMLRSVPERSGLKTVIIPAKRAAGAQLHHTRAIVEPPEMKNLKRKTPISSHIPPLIEMKRRFTEVLPEVSVPANEAVKPVLAELPKELPAVPSNVKSSQLASAQSMVQKPDRTVEVAAKAVEGEPVESQISSLVAQVKQTQVKEVLPAKEMAQGHVNAPEVVRPVVLEQKARQVFAAQPMLPKKAEIETNVVAEMEEALSQNSPMRREVVMQSLQAKEPARQVMPKESNEMNKTPMLVEKEAVKVPSAPVSTTAANVVVAEPEELSKASKNLLKKFPSNLNKPRVPGSQKVEISRVTVPDLELTEPEVKEHEALGISIKVQKPDLNVNDYLVMAYEAIEQNNMALAAQYYQAVLEVKPEHVDAMLGLATISHRLGDTDVARDLYQRLIARAPRDTSVLNNFLVLVSEEAPDKAITELLALEKKNPYYDVLPAQIAAIYANQNRLDKAIEKMARAVELSPEDLMYRYNMAVMLDHAGYKKQAIQAYRQVKKAADAGQNFTLGTEHLQERLTFLLSNVS